MQPQEPLELYKQLLESIGYRIENGMVSEPDGTDGYRPTTARNMRLVIPTREILRQADWKKMIAFHPICENAEGAPSPILKLLNARIMLKLNARLASLMFDLLNLALDTNRQTIMSPQQVSFLSKLPEIKESTGVKFGKVIEKMLNDINDTRFVNVYLKRGGQLSGRLYCRTANVNFPIMDEFERDDDVLWGIKVGKKDKANIAAMFRLVLDLDVLGVDYYSTGSDSTTAPFFDALMRTYVKMQQRLNALAQLFKKVIPSLEEETMANLDWAVLMNDLTLFKGMVPALSGNDREDSDAVVTSEAPVKVAATATTVVKEAPAKQPADNRKLPAGFVSRDGSVAATFGLTPAGQAPQRPLTPDDEVQQWAMRQERQQMQQAGFRGYGAVGRELPAQVNNNQPYGVGRPYNPSATTTMMQPQQASYMQHQQPQQPMRGGGLPLL